MSLKVSKLQEELALKEKQVDVLCDGMQVQREHIAELQEDLNITRDIAAFNFAEVLRFKSFITFRGREYGWRTKV